VVVRCQLGEPAAFGGLVERWHHPLWSFVHRMFGDLARSDDLTQEIWLRVVRGLPRLAAPAPFPAWLFTLARRVGYDELRHSYRQVDTGPLTADEETGPAIETDEVGSLVDRLEHENALAELAPRDREVVALFHLADPPGRRRRDPRSPARDGEVPPAPGTPAAVHCAAKRGDRPMNDARTERFAHDGPGRSTDELPTPSPR